VTLYIERLTDLEVAIEKMKDNIRSYKPSSYIIGIKNNNSSYDEDNIIMSDDEDDGDQSYLEDFNNVAQMDTSIGQSIILDEDRGGVLEDSSIP
jgi:hypothetical protein